MTNMVPLNKQSKKQQKEYHSKKRGDWNGVKPMTRVVPDKTGYDRQKARQEERAARQDGEQA